MNPIAAVVVTYNRCEDLKHCVAALGAQTVASDIIIVDNGSTDGTKEYLATLPDDITVIHQANLGGAGGFYTGTKYAFDKGYEWIWMMDDDGLPEAHQLENLLLVAEKYGHKVLNALVVNKDDHSRFAFGRQELLTSVDLKADYLAQPLSPFNGTFIHRDVMAKVGFIKKEMFIWGDEQEYMARIRKGGYTPYTATRALHYHPREKGSKQWAISLINKGQVMEKPTKMSHYFYRNLGYINWRYSGKMVAVKNILYYTIFFTRKAKFKELAKFYRYYMNGIKGKYN